MFDRLPVFLIGNLQKVQQSTTTETSSKAEEFNLAEKLPQMVPPIASKNKRPKAKSTVRLISETDPTMPVATEQAIPGHVVDRNLEVYPEEQKLKAPSTMPLDKQRRLFESYKDVKEIQVKRPSQHEGLINFNFPNQQLTKTEVKQAQPKPESPDRSLMASKYASLPDESLHGKVNSRKKLMERASKGKESKSLFEDPDLLTGAHEEMSHFPVLVPQNGKSNKTHGNNVTKKKNSSFGPSTDWIISANK